MAETKVKPAAVPMTVEELTYIQVQDLGKRMDGLEKRMDRIEQRMDKIDERIDKLADKIEKLADKIDAHHAELKASTSHISIANISTVGIALGVLYTLFFK